MLLTIVRRVAFASVPVMFAAALGAAPLRQADGVWRNYDFVPGSTVWKATDFSEEPVGRFPAKQIEFVSGNLQIVELNREKALEVASNSVFRLRLPRALPRGFTLEFMLNFPAPNITTTVSFSPLAPSIAGYANDYMLMSGRPGVYRKGREVSNMLMPNITDKWVPVKLQVDDTYAIMYVGAERAAQVPAANFARSATIEFRPNGNQRLKTYLKDFVVAVGVNKMYDALIKTGSFTTRGILFDTGSDRIRPESAPALKEILSTLSEHAALKILIEGHTDNVGDDAANLALSDRRAQAVLQHLTRNGVDAKRLTAQGKGETDPSTPNTTAEGRQQNRRVVIKLVK